MDPLRVNSGSAIFGALFSLRGLMLITVSNLDDASLDDWQEAFYKLYGEKDRELPLYDIMLQIVADSTRIAEAMRRHSYTVALPYIPRVFSWLCSLTSKVAGNDKYRDIGGNNSLADLIWHKYPGVCAFCAKPKCLCPALHVDSMTSEERKTHMLRVADELAKARLQSRPASLDSWVEMFENIYGTVNASRSSAEKTFHFLEEIGEVEIELRKADRKRADFFTLSTTVQWEDEVADVFSWLSSVYLHLRGAVDDLEKLILAFDTFFSTEDGATVSPELWPKLSFSHWVWREFGSDEGGLRCHRCHQSPRCGCNMIKERR